MDCLAGKNPFAKLNCVCIFNSPSTQVTLPDVLDGAAAYDVEKDKIVLEEGKGCKKRFWLSYFVKRKTRRSKINGKIK